MDASLRTKQNDLGWRANSRASSQSWESPPSDAVQALYACLAPSYDVLRAMWALTLGHKIEATIDRWILQYVAPSPSVLDLACGTGANLRRLLRLGRTPRSYLGTDSSPDMLRVALARFGGMPFAAFKRMGVLDADEAVGRFDLVISTYALSHISSPRRAIETSLRMLAPGGRGIFAFISEPRPPLRALLRPLEHRFAFRCVPSDVHEGFYGARELTSFQDGMLTALLLSASSDGGEE
ncbi:MAG: class I SAM-dependent methyltransferase [Candidatus Geothermarchaeales archaeon]